MLPINVNVEFHDRRADSIGNFINMQGSADSPARRSSIRDRLGYIGFDRRTIASFHTARAREITHSTKSKVRQACSFNQAMRETSIGDQTSIGDRSTVILLVGTNVSYCNLIKSAGRGNIRDSIGSLRACRQLAICICIAEERWTSTYH